MLRHGSSHRFTRRPIEPGKLGIAIALDHHVVVGRSCDINTGECKPVRRSRPSAERHRIRVRDGARNWALQRDLGDPEIWIESYQTPTWLDYVRHNHRRTQADAEVTDRLRALHVGDEPTVRRRIIRQVRFTADPPVDKPDPIHHP